VSDAQHVIESAAAGAGRGGGGCSAKGCSGVSQRTRTRFSSLSEVLDEPLPFGVCRPLDQSRPGLLTAGPIETAGGMFVYFVRLSKRERRRPRGFSAEFSIPLPRSPL